MTFDSTVYCGTCWFCRRGQINLCDNRRVLGVSCDEYRRHGAFAEYVAVPQHILVRLPDDVGFRQAAMVEPLSIAFHAVRRTRIALDDTAVVVGAGMIGLLVVQALRAGRLRADHCRGPGPPAAGPGLPARGRRRAARRCGRRAGRSAPPDTAAAAPTWPSRSSASRPPCRRPWPASAKAARLPWWAIWPRKVDFPLQAAVTRELTLHGSCASCGEYPACLDMMGRGTIDVDPLISAAAPLAEGPGWFQRLHQGGEGLTESDSWNPEGPAIMELQGKTPLVTGGGSGIGLGVALALAGEGCRVAISGRNREKLEAAAAAYQGQPPILTRACDVADRDECRRAGGLGHRALGPLDIVVNSAGINVARRKMSELDPADFDRVMAVNCTGFYNVLHAVLPGMRENRSGLIVNISSMAGKRALPLAGPAYCASKFAATALGTAVGLEERPNGIRITNIYPGEVDTPILDQRPVPVPAEKRAQMVHPEDIGHCVVALAKLPPNVIVPELVITPTYQEFM